MRSQYIVELKDLNKSYGTKQVISNLNMHMKKEEIYGFVGPNGAGKSTVMKMILDLIQPDSGSIKVFGEKVTEDNYEIRSGIGSIIENPYFYSKLTARKNLELHCKYMDMTKKGRIEEVLRMVSLYDDADRTVSHYSLGMKQRLAIARAILADPQLLILDEPINALDPDGILQMRDLFKRLCSEYGMSIMISSHILSELELIADTIGFIKDGHLVNELTMNDIHKLQEEFIEIQVDDIHRAEEILKKKYTIEIRNGKIVIKDKNVAEIELTSLIAKNQIGLISIKRESKNLEDFFFQIMKS